MSGGELARVEASSGNTRARGLAVRLRFVRAFIAALLRSLQIWIHNIPSEGLDFHCLQRLEAVHAGAVTQIRCAAMHLLSAGEDGKVKALAMYGSSWGFGGSAALERTQRVPGRVRSVFVDTSGDVEPGCSLLYVTTNRGALHVFRLGSTV